MSCFPRILPRLRFLFIVVCGAGVLQGQDPYFLESRLVANPSFQFHPSPADWRDINVYQIFTDRFFDGDPSNNNARTMRAGTGWYGEPTLGKSWYNTGNSANANERHLAQGGDWEGLRQKIPYLNSMGVKAVWISSVQRNEQGVDKRYTPYHAYHPTDYWRCEPLFGDVAKLRQVIDELHANGIYVILDVVPNHLADLVRRIDGNESQYFASCNTANINWADGIQHPFPFNRLDWIHCNGQINNYDAYPETQLGSFRGTDDLATERQDVQDALAAAFKNLIDATDCDGFRVDAIKHVDHVWIKNWATSMRTHAASRGKGDFIIFGELFSFDDNFHKFFTGDVGSGFNSAMWFSMMNTMKSVFAGSGATSALTGALNGVHNGDTFGVEGNQRAITFIDNHDVDRVSLNYATTWPEMLRPAMGLLYCAAPVPTVLYGTEHGFNQGGTPNMGIDDGDYQRECMMNFGYQWGNAQGDKFNASSPIRDLIAQLNAAREQYACLRRGNFTQRWQNTGGRGIFAFTRALGNEEALVVLNTDWSSALGCTPAVGKPDGTVFTNVLNPAETLAVTGGTLNVTVASRGLKVFVAAPAVQNPATVVTSCAPGQLTITYTPNQGPLANGTTPLKIGIGHDGFQDVAVFNMTDNGNGSWSYVYNTAAATSVADFYFRDSGSPILYDNNATQDWHVDITPCNGVVPGFVMDGLRDSDHYLVVSNGMNIWAAVRGTKLYFSTWSSEGGGNDHFVLCSANFGNPTDHPWKNAGVSKANFWFGGWPWLAAEGDNNFKALNNGGASGQHAEGPGGQVLEGVVDLVEVFGAVPEVVYLTALAYGSAAGGGIVSQAPAAWEANNNVEIMEMAPLRIEEIRDDDADGWFDGGWPGFESEVDGVVADANYGLRRFFLDEVAGETANLTFRFTPNTNPAEAVSDVAVITNLNRREHAVIQEDRDTVGETSATYYRAYPMTNEGGVWEAAVPVLQCGAYRATVRYFVDGEGPFYFTTGGQRRDLAVVVSPKKALDTTIYEVNPLIVEASAPTEAGRSTLDDLWTANSGPTEAVSTEKFQDLGVNMLWLQPVHPIGVEARGVDPVGMAPYQPGSPYAVQDYWSVLPALGADNTAAGALAEFQTMVSEFDDNGIGVMMDGTFNHSAPDAVFGQGGFDLFGLPAGDLIRDTKPGWFSKTGNYGQPAANAGEQAVAPDRRGFPKWDDVRDFYFGNYDTLVKFDSDSHTQEHLLERDALQPLSAETRQLWEYFAHYPAYWLEQSGHPAGTPATESHRGIDGLRCDFAQGLPNEFWEYCINRTRSVKWDFLFMAESLDGTRTVNGSSRHGVSFRSARQFDILNESIVFYWRDTYFDYPAEGVGTGGPGVRQTGNTFNAYVDRNAAYEGVVLLQNLTGHDEVFPSDDPYELLHAYAQVAVLKGAPMLMYGQEAGAQNSFANYGFTGGIGNADHNWNRYEDNLNKWIPNFKAWNSMTSVWGNADVDLEEYYGRINRARLGSPALRDAGDFFLNTTGGGFAPEMLAVAKVDSADSGPGRDIVLAFVNNDPAGGSVPPTNFALSGPAGAFLGIDPGANYNVTNLLSANPATPLWGTDRSGQDLLDNGITVILGEPAAQLGQAQYLRLIDTSVPRDTDGDLLPDGWELEYGLDPNDSIGRDGATGDFDGDGNSNWTEFLAGTDPADSLSVFHVIAVQPMPASANVTWTSVPGRSYRIWTSVDLQDWNLVSVGEIPVVVPASGGESTTYAVDGAPAERFFRVEVLE